MLQLTNIRKTFFPGTINERVALDGVDLHLDEGDFVTIIGSNGAGKSTLLNVISGKLRQDEGTVIIDDRDVSKMPDWKRARYLGRVFQDPMAGTAPELSIEQNMALALKRASPRGLKLGVNNKRRAQFREVLTQLELGLESRLKARVGLLSGGQRQALSLLMASFTHPRILLLDEHTAALDPQRAQHVTDLTERIVAQNGLTTVMVTHNMAQALQLGNRLIMMHEGRIVLELNEEEKSRYTVSDLLDAFKNLKGAVLDDKTMLDSA